MFLLNIDHPSNYTQKIWGRILRNLEMMRGRSNVTLSFNLFEKEPRGDYILDIAKEYGFKHIRLCLSLPVFNARNSSLPITELPEIAPFVMAFVDKAESLGLSVIFDNAVPLCMFNNEQAGKLLLHGVLDLKRNTHCNPIIDIGPDLSVWSCFCLSSVANRSLRDFNNLTEAKEFYTRIWEVYQGKVYPMAKCADCLYREKWSCQGGCLTYALETDNGQRYQQNTIEHLEGGQAPNNKLSLADAVILRRYDIPYEKYILSNTLTDVEFEVGESLQSILPMLNGSHTAEELAETLIGTSPDSGSLQAFLHDTAKECYPKVFDELVRQGFLKETVC